MISLIICSRNNDISEELKKNIQATINSPYEWVIIDNSKNQYSIFEAYNIGIHRSNGDLLCFMHDDIKINTEDWGKILYEIFNSNKRIGLIGVVGSKIKTLAPSGWNTHNDSSICVNIIQHMKTGEVKYHHGFQNSIEKVVAIDGLFMVSKSATGVKFNTSLEGFHCYDLTFCLDHIASGFDIVATDKIIIEHYSEGNFSPEWLRTTMLVHEKYGHMLPVSANSITIEKNHEVKAYKGFIKRCLQKNEYALAFLNFRRLVKYNPLTLLDIRFYGLVILKYILFKGWWK